MFLISFFDFPEARQVLFQDPASSMMYFIISAHNTIMFYLFIIICLVILLMSYIVYTANGLLFSFYLNFTADLFSPCSWLTKQKTADTKLVSLFYVSNKLQKWSEENILETLWTEYPTLLIVILVFPVLIFLFAFEEIEGSQWDLVIKIIGNQWFWSYEVVSFPVFDMPGTSNMNFDPLFRTKLFSFESRLIPEQELVYGQFRLLDVDNALVIPINHSIHIFVTSADVIHSWSIPSLGIKLDAVPGRINSINFVLTRPCILYGQCSELCGVNHFAMPIKLIGFDSEHLYSIKLKQL